MVWLFFKRRMGHESGESLLHGLEPFLLDRRELGFDPVETCGEDLFYPGSKGLPDPVQILLGILQYGLYPDLLFRIEFQLVGQAFHEHGLDRRRPLLVKCFDPVLDYQAGAQNPGKDAQYKDGGDAGNCF